MNQHVPYSDRLNEKVQKEYDAFVEQLKALPPEQMIDHAYEKVFKEDLVLALSDAKLSNAAAKALLRLQAPLDTLYQDWLDKDVSYMDLLHDVVDYRAEKAVKEMKQKEKER